MATPFVNVYDFFLTKVKDYNFIKLNQDGVLEDSLFKYLRSSTVKFTSCNKDLSMDLTNKEFVGDLDDFEMEILASLMTVSYVGGKILNVSNFEPIMSDKEYVKYSQSNHLDKMQKTKKELDAEVSHLMSIYSFKDGLEDIK